MAEKTLAALQHAVCALCGVVYVCIIVFSSLGVCVCVGSALNVLTYIYVYSKDQGQGDGQIKQALPFCTHGRKRKQQHGNLLSPSAVSSATLVCVSRLTYAVSVFNMPTLAKKQQQLSHVYVCGMLYSLLMAVSHCLLDNVCTF